MRGERCFSRRLVEASALIKGPISMMATVALPPLPLCFLRPCLLVSRFANALLKRMLNPYTGQVYTVDVSPKLSLPRFGRRSGERR